MTSVATVPLELLGTAAFVPRVSGVVAGLPPLISSWALGTLWATAALTASALLPDIGFLNASVTGLSLPLRDDLRSSALLSVTVVVGCAFALNVAKPSS